MIEHCTLIEVTIGGIGIGTVEELGEFEHIVCVARLWAVDVVHIVDACFLGGEVFASAVSSYGKRAFLCNKIPEVLACLMPFSVAVKFSYALKTNNLRYLCIGMHIVETVLMVLHRGEQLSVGKAAGAVEITSVARHGVCICYHLVHTAMLIAEHTFHLFVAKLRCVIHCPVAELQEELACIFITAIEPCVAQSGIHFVEIIEWCPRTEIFTEVTLAEC